MYANGASFWITCTAWTGIFSRQESWTPVVVTPLRLLWAKFGAEVWAIDLDPAVEVAAKHCRDRKTFR